MGVQDVVVGDVGMHIDRRKLARTSEQTSSVLCVYKGGDGVGGGGMGIKQTNKKIPPPHTHTQKKIVAIVTPNSGA